MPIDADELLDHAWFCNLDHWSGRVVDEDIVNEAHTLDVALVTHACWNDGPGYSVEILRDWYLQRTYVCSSCKTEEDKKTNYCPYCGAKMDGENDESD